MIETKEKRIGEATYAVTQLPARRALRLKAKLLKLFGPAVIQILLTSEEPQEKIDEMTAEQLSSQLAISPVDTYKIQDMRKAAIVRGVQLLVANLDDKTFDELCLEVLQGVRRDGQELNSGIIDHVFAGHLRELYEVIYFVLEVNYADFFGMSPTGSLSEALKGQEADTKKTYTYK